MVNLYTYILITLILSFQCKIQSVTVKIKGYNVFIRQERSSSVIHKAQDNYNFSFDI